MRLQKQLSALLNTIGIHKYYLIPVTLFVAVFLSFLVIASLHVRPCSDDLWFYYSFQENGWLGSVLMFDFNVRWTSFLIFNTICLFPEGFQSLHSGYFVYYLITFTLLYLGLMRAIRLLTNFIAESPPSSFSVVLLSGLVFSALYFTTTQAIEVWFWTLASTIYLWPLVFLFWGIAEFFSARKLRSYLIISLTFFLFSGTLETFVLIGFCLLFLMAVYFWKKKRTLLLKKTLIALISMAIIPLINYTGSGIVNRISFEKQYYNWSTQSKLFSDNVFTFLDKNLVISYPRLLVFLLILICISFMFSKLKPKLSFSVSLKNIFLLNIAILLLVALVNYIPLYLVFQNLGPARASAPMNYFLCISTCFWAVVLGANKFQSPKSLLAPLLSAVILIVLLSYKTVTQYKLGSAYARAYNERIVKIIESNDCEEAVIFVEKLPDSGIITSQEVSTFCDSKRYNLSTKYLGKLNGVDKYVLLKPDN